CSVVGLVPLATISGYPQPSAWRIPNTASNSARIWYSQTPGATIAIARMWPSALMSTACCMRAISAADLISRRGANTGAALATARSGCARASSARTLAARGHKPCHIAEIRGVAYFRDATPRRGFGGVELVAGPALLRRVRFGHVEHLARRRIRRQHQDSALLVDAGEVPEIVLLPVGIVHVIREHARLGAVEHQHLARRHRGQHRRPPRRPLGRRRRGSLLGRGRRPHPDCGPAAGTGRRRAQQRKAGSRASDNTENA